MFRFLLFFVLNLIPLGAIAQMKTPFVSYDFKKDAQYSSKLTALKKAEIKGGMANTKSIAAWAYDHKDWDTAIDYFEKLIVDAPTAENFFKLGLPLPEGRWRFRVFFLCPM